MSIVVVVPTIRYETEYQEFLKAWDNQFRAFSVDLITIEDGETQKIHYHRYWEDGSRPMLFLSPNDLMREDYDLIPKKSPACRNLGFAGVAKGWNIHNCEMILTLDDDTRPYGDTIGDHLKQLQRRVPVSWLSSTQDGELYMRGFPYGVRTEAPVKVSHGVWHGVPDLDAPTQLVLGARHDVKFYRGPVPWGIYMPICGMNLAFTFDMLKHVYYAPVVDFPGAERFDDIWMGTHLTDAAVVDDFAIVSGYAAVKHERASNIWVNLRNEAVGMKHNEDYWRLGNHGQHPWFTEYDDKRRRWRQLVQSWQKSVSIS